MCKKRIKIKSGRYITLSLNDEWNCIEFYENGVKLDGEFEFEDESPDEDKTAFLIKRMYCPEKYIRQGIGTKALKFFRSVTDCENLYTHSNDGIQRDNGSHLTGDAPAFADAMRKKKVIDYQD